MQWDASKNSGFSIEKPWLPVNKNYKTVNVAAQEKDPNSVLHHFRNMVALRKENLVFVYGKYTLLQKEHKTIYAYTRILEDKKMLVLLNFSDQNSSIKIPEIKTTDGLLINNYKNIDHQADKITLQPYQAVIYSLKNESIYYEKNKL